MKPKQLRFRSRSFPTHVCFCFGLAASILASSEVKAVDGTWINATTGGVWSNAANWSGGVADGVDAIANFSTLNITADNTVTLDSARTLGSMLFSDTTASNNWIISGPGVLTLQTSTATAPTVTVTNQTATLGVVLAGTQGITKAGASTLVLSGANTYTGATIVNAGTLRFANTAALYGGNSANWTEANLNAKTGTTLAFNVGGAGEFTTANVTTLLTNLATSSSATTGLNAGALIGFDTTNSGGSFTIADVIANTTGASGGSLGLTKLGTTTLVLSAANTYTGTTAVNAGTLEVTGSLGSLATRTGAVALAASGAILNLNGGSIFGTTLTVNNPGTFNLINNGTLNLSGNFAIAANNANNAGLAVLTSGTATVSSVTVSRTNQVVTALAIAGSVTQGLYVNGGTLNVATTLQVGSSSSNVNSGANMRMDAGAVNVTGVTTVSTNNSTRISILDINGGIFTSTDTVGAGIQVGGIGAAGAGSGELIVRGGTVIANKITIGSSTQTGGINGLLMRGGTIYLGAGGIVAGGSSGTNVTTIELGGTTGGAPTTTPILAATADWSSSVNITLGNSTTAVAPTIQTADSANSPHNIALSGVLSGTGGLTKTGAGNLTLTGVNTYTGATTVNAGKLIVGTGGTSSLASAVTVNTGGSLAGKGTISGL